MPTPGRVYNNIIDFQSTLPHYKFNFTLFGEKRSISVLQDFSDQGDIGHVLWDCEWILCTYLLMPQNVSRWNGAVCIEMGAGCAMGATLLWHCGATVVATDLADIIEKVTIPNLNHTFSECSGNSSLTSLMKRKHQYVAAPLEWGNDEHAEKLDVMLMAKMGVVSKVEAAKKSGSSKGGNSSNNINKKNGASKAAILVQQQQQQEKDKSEESKKCKNENDDEEGKEGEGQENEEEDLVINVTASDRPTQSKIDYIMGADMIYHTEQHEPLMRSLLTLMNESTIFIFVHRKRNEHDTNFIDALKKTFDIIRETPIADISKLFPKPTIRVYEFVLKKKQ